jgi:hypothetical protein
MTHMVIATPASNVPESHGNTSSRASHLAAGVPRNVREIERERPATRTRTVSAKMPRRKSNAFVSCKFPETSPRPRRGSLTACVAGVDEDDRDSACRVGRVVVAGVDGVVASGTARVVPGGVGWVVAGAVGWVVADGGDDIAVSGCP